MLAPVPMAMPTVHGEGHCHSKGSSRRSLPPPLAQGPGPPGGGTAAAARHAASLLPACLPPGLLPVALACGSSLSPWRQAGDLPVGAEFYRQHTTTLAVPRPPQRHSRDRQTPLSSVQSARRPRQGRRERSPSFLPSRARQGSTGDHERKTSLVFSKEPSNTWTSHSSERACPIFRNSLAGDERARRSRQQDTVFR